MSFCWPVDGEKAGVDGSDAGAAARHESPVFAGARIEPVAGLAAAGERTSRVAPARWPIEERVRVGTPASGPHDDDKTKRRADANDQSSV
jgi:hypothetical protein